MVHMEPGKLLLARNVITTCETSGVDEDIPFDEYSPARPALPARIS